LKSNQTGIKFGGAMKSGAIDYYKHAHKWGRADMYLCQIHTFYEQIRPIGPEISIKLKNVVYFSLLNKAKRQLRQLEKMYLVGLYIHI